MKILLSSISLVSLMFFTGCVSQTDLHKTNIPNGRWVSVNPHGYVPPNTDVYFKKPSANGGVVDPTLANEALGQNVNTVFIQDKAVTKDGE